MLGSLFKRTEQMPEVKVGSVFRHQLPGQVVEMAKVVDVGDDPQGIPHVTYELRVVNARLAAYVERRTLGLKTFSERYMDSAQA